MADDNIALLTIDNVPINSIQSNNNLNQRYTYTYHNHFKQTNGIQYI